MAMIRMAASFAVSDALRAVVALATSLVAARALGPDDFGRWLLCLAWASVLVVVFDLGYGVLLTREAARDAADLGRSVSRALVTRMGLFIPAGATLALAAPFAVDQRDLVNGLRVAVAIAAGGAAYGLFASVFRGNPRWLLPSLGIDTSGALLQLAAAWWAASRGIGLVGLLALYAAAQALQLAAAVVMWRAVRSPEHRLEWPAWGTLAPLVGRAWPFTLAGLVANAQMRVAPIALGAMASASDVAAFGVAWRLAALAKMVPHAAFAGALPIFARREGSARRQASRRPRKADGEHQRQFAPGVGPQRQWKEDGGAGPQGLRARFDAAVIAFAATAAVAVGVFAAPLVRLTYGPEFAAASLPLMWIGAWILPSLVNGGRKVYLIARDEERVALRWSAAALAIQGGGCMVLVPLFGASGAAAALAVGEIAAWWPLRRAVVGGVRLQADERVPRVRLQADDRVVQADEAWSSR